ncbi:alpha/beta hydrolase-fold protein [Aquimarina sp. AU119]|uniref:alpha/beta hydrolase-fold protein n=1 Tax=Aquimarina sp. AU119 TaxID=2108528 RepID=UPI000D69E3EE|nr:alpha/beta hydrolase-fold protein [Aquimarina sp. AU119]
MKNYIIIISLLLICRVKGQLIDNSNDIETFEIESKFLKETQNVKVALPYGYHKSTKSYPIILILDHQLMFPTMTAIVNQLSSTSRMPESIVFAITEGNKHRTYYAPDLYDNHKKRSYGYGNHQEEFKMFLEKEVFPKLASTYRTVNFKTLIGFSPSSVFTLDIFCKQPKLFQAYIAIASGNIIGDGYVKNKNLIDAIESSLAHNSSHNAYLYVVSGGKDLNDHPDIKDNITSFNQRLSPFITNKFKAKAEIIDGEGHTDVLLPGLINAMDFIFPKERWVVDYIDIINTSGNAKENIDLFYNNLSQEYGFTIYPNMNRLYSMNCIKNIGNRLLSQKRITETIELYRYWTQLYPLSSTSHAYLGLALKVAGNKKESIKSYEKAIKIAKQESNPELLTYKKSLEELEQNIKK